MAMTTYPLNNVQYNAEDAELYNAVRMSGVWSGSAFDAEVTGNDTIVTIGEGLAWISNTKFSGKVVAQKEPIAVDLGVADPSYNRIDVLAIQFNSVENKTDIIVKKGVASSTPEIPERSTTENLYELYLYSVLRTDGSSVISKSNITDLRDNREYCGYMQDSIKPGYAPSLMEHNDGKDFRFWVGTEAEYEEQKDNLSENVFCIITDDKKEEEINNFIKDLANKLSKSGDIFEGTNIIYKTPSSASKVAIHNGKAAKEGAGIWLYGNDSDGAGKARIQVYDVDSDKYRQLDVCPDGDLKWNGELVYTSIEDTTYPGCYYRMVDGVKEWINPPMVSGVEYRTTKRFKGKPVYVSQADFGSLPASGSTTVSFGKMGDAFDNVVSLNAMAIDSGNKFYPFPFVTSQGELRAMVRMGGVRTVYIGTFSDLSSYTGRIIIEYTKA